MRKGIKGKMARNTITKRHFPFSHFSFPYTYFISQMQCEILLPVRKRKNPGAFSDAVGVYGIKK
jgi:hypothetical protein